MFYFQTPNNITSVKIAPNLRLDYIYNNANKDMPYFVVYSNQHKSDVCYADELTLKILKQVRRAKKIKDIISTLSDQFDANTIKQQLAHLLHAKIIIDTNYQISDDFAAFWLDNDILPSEAQKRLNRYSFFIVNLTNKKTLENTVKKTLKQVGLSIADKQGTNTITLVLVHDYLQQELDTIQADFDIQTQPWIMLNLLGETPLVGPIFNQNEQAPCYQCLRKRIVENRQVRSTIGRYVPNGELITPYFTDAGAINSTAYQFTLEIAKHVVLGETLSQNITEFNWLNNTTNRHHVDKIPQCNFCGTILDTDRTPEKFIFDQPQTVVKTSGGYKATSAIKTLKKYIHLVSPISGVVSYLKRTSEQGDDWNYVYESGNNIALQSDNIHISLNSVRMSNAGKGQTKDQAKASALCESIERYCCAYQGDEISKTMRFIDFADGDALLPNTFMHYSDSQYEQGNTKSAHTNPFHFVPQPTKLDQPYQWSPIWSVFEDKPVWVPTQLLYFGYPYKNECIATADTNGVAAGNSKTEAFVQAFLECIERENISIWWFNRLQYTEVDLTNFTDYTQQAVHIYQQQYQRKLYAIDISNDLEIPTFVVISYNLNTDHYQEICFSAASHFDAELAMTRAVCEHNQLLTLIKKNSANKHYQELSHEFAEWLKTADINKPEFSYLIPSQDETRVLSDYPKFNDGELIQQREKCIDLCKRQNWDLYIADFTRIDIGMTVLRVLIPQLRTMHTRLAKGRLYDVPVTLGKRKKPYKENELNPIAIFI